MLTGIIAAAVRVGVGVFVVAASVCRYSCHWINQTRREKASQCLQESWFPEEP
jgi:hypothetical protein